MLAARANTAEAREIAEETGPHHPSLPPPHDTGPSGERNSHIEGLFKSSPRGQPLLTHWVQVWFDWRLASAFAEPRIHVKVTEVTRGGKAQEMLLKAGWTFAMRNPPYGSAPEVAWDIHAKDDERT